MKKIGAVMALGAVLLFWNLGGHDLWAPDEPYFGEGAREMVADGQWAVPHVNGVITTDKPPLFFWLIAAFSLPGGEVTEWTARLPSALAGMGTLLLVMMVGRRLGDESTAVLAGLVLSTTFLFMEEARWAHIDALLCFLIWVALSAFVAWRAGEADGRAAGLLFWLAAALAVLAKGPVGLLLPLGIVLITLALDRDLGSWRDFAPVAGPLLFAVLIAAWMVLATVGGEGEYSVFGALKEHAIDRAIHGMHHKRPPWYYAKVLPVVLMPWVGLVPGAVLLAFRRRRVTDRFLLVVVFFVVLFFSISTEKRGLYILPTLPAFALLVARFIGAQTGQQQGHRGDTELVDRRWYYGGQWAIGGLMTLVGIALPFLAARRDEVPFWIPAVLAGLFLVTGVKTLFACRRRLGLAAALTPAAGFAVVFLFVATFAYAHLEPIKSARSFSEKIKTATESSRAAGERVVAFDLGNLPKAFAFYTDGIYTIDTADPGILAQHLRKDRETWAVVNRDKLDLLPEDARGRITVVDSTRLSRRNVLLITNQPPGAEDSSR